MIYGRLIVKLVLVTDRLRSAAGIAEKTMQLAVLFALGCYRSTRFLRTPKCRFYPSCSEYLAGSVRRHGTAKGMILGFLRIAKCHPFHDGGVDLVPAEFRLKEILTQPPRRCCNGQFDNLSRGNS